ncbi:helix-turn-helix domain-containing protein [Nonomuraea sp. NPDC048916]|uniref:winged helix-turn-helix transcriptional regulator n=1 Tax=Nonomuraea sp. NPDC048916 TaxID=3154232 RepID=UPI0033C6783B
MLGRLYDNEVCSAARALEVVGERWSLLIIRNAMFAGATRFTEFQRRLGIAPNILANRLERFVEAGLMETRPQPDAPETREYVLTGKGLDLQPVIIALTHWGDRWAAPNGPPIIYEHDGCGGTVHQRLSCEACAATPAPAQVSARRGPGMPPGR